jgi:hypothetical protein
MLLILLLVSSSSILALKYTFFGFTTGIYCDTRTYGRQKRIKYIRNKKLMTESERTDDEAQIKSDFVEKKIDVYFLGPLH